VLQTERKRNPPTPRMPATRIVFVTAPQAAIRQLTPSFILQHCTYASPCVDLADSVTINASQRYPCRYACRHISLRHSLLFDDDLYIAAYRDCGSKLFSFSGHHLNGELIASATEPVFETLRRREQWRMPTIGSLRRPCAERAWCSGIVVFGFQEMEGKATATAQGLGI
jgi:hypothetical protein